MYDTHIHGINNDRIGRLSHRLAVQDDIDVNFHSWCYLPSTKHNYASSDTAEIQTLSLSLSLSLCEQWLSYFVGIM